MKKENERIVKENNQLHMEIIEAKETKEGQEKNWRETVRRLEHENDDLRHVAAQKDFRFKEMEEQLSKLKRKLENVMEKAYWPSQTEILKALPREMTETEENQFGKPQEIQMSCYLPEELFEHERQVGP